MSEPKCAKERAMGRYKDQKRRVISKDQVRPDKSDWLTEGS